MTKIRQYFAFMGLFVMVCLAESRVAAGQMKPAPPNSQVDLSTFGYSGLSPLNRFTERFNLSLKLVDSDHLLFTFNAHSAQGLLERRPDCAPTNSCHQIRAIVIDLRNNEVTAEADWYLYDYRRYLWSFWGMGPFLVRRSNSIFLVDSDLRRSFCIRPRTTCFGAESLWIGSNLFSSHGFRRTQTMNNMNKIQIG